MVSLFIFDVVLCLLWCFFLKITLQLQLSLLFILIILQKKLAIPVKLVKNTVTVQKNSQIRLNIKFYRSHHDHYNQKYC